MTTIYNWLAEDTSTGDTLQQWNESKPQAWIDDSDITNIRFNEFVEEDRFDWANALANNRQTSLDAVRSTTTSTTFQTKLSYQTDELTGLFRINWSAYLDSDKEGVEVRLRNITDGVTVGSVAEWVPSSSAIERNPVMGVTEMAFAEEIKTFEIQFRSKKSGKTVGIQEATFRIWRVGL